MNIHEKLQKMIPEFIFDKFFIDNSSMVICLFSKFTYENRMNLKLIKKCIKLVNKFKKDDFFISEFIISLYDQDKEYTNEFISILDNETAKAANKTLDMWRKGNSI